MSGIRGAISAQDGRFVPVHGKGHGPVNLGGGERRPAPDDRDGEILELLQGHDLAGGV